MVFRFFFFWQYMGQKTKTCNLQAYSNIRSQGGTSSLMPSWDAKWPCWTQGFIIGWSDAIFSYAMYREKWSNSLYFYSHQSSPPPINHFSLFNFQTSATQRLRRSPNLRQHQSRRQAWVLDSHSNRSNLHMLDQHVSNNI